MVLIGKHVKLLINKQQAGTSNIDCQRAIPCAK